MEGLTIDLATLISFVTVVITYLFAELSKKFNWVETSHSWTSEGHAILGAVYLNLKNYIESAKHLKKALEWEPDNIALIKQYVMVLEELVDKIE